jgi:hypothetical protein
MVFDFFAFHVVDFPSTSIKSSSLPGSVFLCFLTSNITSADFKTNFWDANTYLLFVQEYDRTAILNICKDKPIEEKIHQLTHTTLCVNGIFLL